jgi:flagellar hook assembly protein FlgD
MVKMGPNPFAGQLNIDFSLLSATHLTILVSDINGKPVQTLYDAGIASGLHHLAWYGNDQTGNALKPGIYLVQFFTTDGPPVSFKIIRSR